MPNLQTPEEQPAISGAYIPADWLTNEPPALEFCVAPLVPIGAVTIINAHGGTGKSLLALKMAVHVALGLDILDATTCGGKVAYMSLEDPEPVFRERLYKIVKNMPEEVWPRLEELSQKLMFIDRYGKPTLMAGFDSGKVVETNNPWALVAHLRAEDIKCLIVDTFVRTHSLNENDNAQMGALLVLFEKVAKEAGCGVILIHHQPKAYLGKEYAARGASAITDNARSVIHLEKVDPKEVDKFGEEDIRIAVMEGRLVRVSHTKHNYSAEHPDQYLEITHDGVPIEKFPLLSESNIMERRYSEIVEWCKNQWKGKPITKTNIDDHYKEIRPKGTNYGKEMYKRALKLAIEDEYAVKTAPPEDGSKNPKAEYYDLFGFDEK